MTDRSDPSDIPIVVSDQEIERILDAIGSNSFLPTSIAIDSRRTCPERLSASASGSSSKIRRPKKRFSSDSAGC